MKNGWERERERKAEESEEEEEALKVANWMDRQAGSGGGDESRKSTHRWRKWRPATAAAAAVVCTCWWVMELTL